ncbi:MAG: hypothetical protein R3240_13490, partial [Gammaproteobacteria bacterium]|nr:hypothetical protein [Gammaproteobacteria bacterium]
MTVSIFVLLGALTVTYLHAQHVSEKEKVRLEKALQEGSELVLPLLVDRTVHEDFSSVHALIDRQVKLKNDVFSIEWQFANGISIIANSNLPESKAPGWFAAILALPPETIHYFNAKAYGFDARLAYNVSS